MLTVPTKVIVLAVASLLTVILIYSSITEFDVVAKPKHIDNLCRDATPTIKGAVKAEVCCQIINGQISVCIKCQYDANDNSVGSCINFYPERQTPGGSSTLPPTFAGSSLSSGNNTGGITNGQTGPPNHLGTVPSSNNNTVTPPALTLTKEHNTASPSVPSSENSNPSTNTGQDQQSSGHHHKGEQNGGGTSSTGNTQSGNNNPSSGESTNGKNDNSNNR
jgi:hypothetical protein